MDLILATDLKKGSIVHGMSGKRDEYRPIITPLASSSDPCRYLEEIRPRYLYVADLDRIAGTGNHDWLIPALADQVDLLMIDRGCQNPEDMTNHPRVINIIGTETAGSDFEAYTKGYLSVDMKDGRVIPDNADPVTVLSRAGTCAFEGCILLDIGGVGTQRGLDPSRLDTYRASYPGHLIWGGGIATMDDLYLLRDSDYEGAIIATALHTGKISPDLIRSGHLC